VLGDPFNAADPLIGRMLDGRYEVLERLGEGGAGVVYRGRQAHLGRFVAIKVLHQDTASSAEWRRRFQREAMALSVLAHPHVVPVTDFGVDNGVPFLVMELLEGQTLGALINEGPLPLWRALEIARQTLRVLAFSHVKGVVHHDLKPSNVFLQALPDQADHVRLLDFGMAKFLEGSSSRAPAEVTRAGAAIGTPAYMSPEQVKGAPTDERTDVYAAGLLLFELLAGRRPFVADTAEGYLAAHLTAPVPSLAKLRPKLGHASLSFQAVVERAMAKKPAERFENAFEMLVALDDVVARLPAAVVSGGRAEARRTPMPRARSAAASRPRFWPRAMLLVILAAGIAAVAVYLRREGAKQAATTGAPAAPPPKPALPAAQAPTATPPSPAPPPPAPSLPSPEPEPPTSPPVQAQAPMDPEPPERPAQPDNDAKAAQGARNPWRQPVPRPLRPIRDRVKRGVHLSQRALVPAYEFARKHPDDPRPWLLLGAAYARSDWFRDSVERYLRAHQVDSTCRGDPQMLADLLKAAAHPVAGRSAARAIRDIYGVEAIPALEQALEQRRGDPEATARLTRLRESLPR
jgi:serine/threonine-protein kinase